ncbi:MAG: hypothetical protein ABGY96_13535 [bacterium]|nr:hypothetical protein [Gammaproteobacteria bacterium]HIL95369.1 hypothetical protein [Pseudomonadales bacterium]
MNYHDQTFENERIELHEKTFKNCTFVNCELVYDGDRSPTFSNNTFVDTVFVFTGAAVRTLYFLGNIYHAGEGGREVVDRTFAEIKNGEIHGHEVRTQAPHTVDHSLA